MDIGIDITSIVNTAMANIDSQLYSRAVRAANELRNAELEVLRGHRSGRSYVLAASGRKRRNGSIARRSYAASAPGEPPAVRTGTLRSSWRPIIVEQKNPAIESNVLYAPFLEQGTSKMAPRPYEQKIIDKAMPNIEAIYQEPWFS